MISILFAAALALAPCDAGAGTNAQCGTLTVPENRRAPARRSIDLYFVLVPGKSRSSDAVFILAGGPGGAATNMTSFAVRTLGEGGRDIVLVDIRGTGRSNPLRCPDPPTLFSDLFDPERLAACRAELEKKADLTQYTTVQVVHDLEDVRKALGYQKVTLYGTSYGTRVAQEYMRRYPRSVRAAILDGVVPPSLAMPTNYAEYSERSLQRVLALCKVDQACRTAFPDPEGDLAALLKAAENGIDVGGDKLQRPLFGEVFRNFLYSPSVYPRLPQAMHAAARGDWSHFGNMATRYARGIREVYLGMFLSVTCAEDLPRVDEKAIREESKGTVLGTYRLDQQLGACKVWPRAAVDAQMGKPVRSSIPTLIVSGEYDPVTPPEYGDEVARTLSRSLHVVFPYGSHSGDMGGCLDQVLSEFIREGSVDALDTSCVKSATPPPFVTSAKTQ